MQYYGWKNKLNLLLRIRITFPGPYGAGPLKEAASGPTPPDPVGAPGGPPKIAPEPFSRDDLLVIDGETTFAKYPKVKMKYLRI